jgi:predicted CopG family antitoxin
MSVFISGINMAKYISIRDEVLSAVEGCRQGNQTNSDIIMMMYMFCKTNDLKGIK